MTDQASSDQLKWELIDHDDEEAVKSHYRAAVPQRGGEYNAFILEYMRGAGRTVGATFLAPGETGPTIDNPTIKSPIQFYRNDDDTATIDDAKRAAQQHHNAGGRSRRWAEYMRDNEPPTPQSSLPPAGAGDPRDPATKDSNCRRCGSWTQWGWCPNCQPTEFNRLP